MPATRRPYEVRSTPRANQQIAALRGPHKRSYEAFEQDLARRGCAALDYRLTGDDPLDRLCVKHLRGRDRVVVTFEADTAWVLLVGPHDEGDRAADVYRSLYALTGLDAPDRPRTKPSCCADSGLDPVLPVAVVDELVRRARALRR